MGGRYLYARDVDQGHRLAFITDAIYLTNTNKGYQYSLSVQLQKNFSNRSWVNVFYTYGQAKDVNSGTSSQAASNFVYNNIRYNPNDPELTWSNFDVRHRLGVAFSWQFNFFRRAPTSPEHVLRRRGPAGRIRPHTTSSTPTATRPRATTWSTSPPARARSSS